MEDFKMKPSPLHMSPEDINRLVEEGSIGLLDQLGPPPVLNAETLLSGRVNELWPGGPELPAETPRRMFDLHYEYTSYAPPSERWTCVDWNTYDGAPDSEGCSTFIGRGRTEHEARIDLLEQFAEYDADLKDEQKRTHVVGLGHPEQPPEVVVEPYRDPDED